MTAAKTITSLRELRKEVENDGSLESPIIQYHVKNFDDTRFNFQLACENMEIVQRSVSENIDDKYIKERFKDAVSIYNPTYSKMKDQLRLASFMIRECSIYERMLEIVFKTLREREKEIETLKNQIGEVNEEFVKKYTSSVPTENANTASTVIDVVKKARQLNQIKEIQKKLAN